jgi:hypothetical protein
MLSKNEAYNAELHRKADKPPANRVLTPEQAFTLLRSKGFQIVESNEPIESTLLKKEPAA